MQKELNVSSDDFFHSSIGPLNYKMHCCYLQCMVIESLQKWFFVKLLYLFYMQDFWNVLSKKNIRFNLIQDLHKTQKWWLLQKMPCCWYFLCISFYIINCWHDIVWVQFRCFRLHHSDYSLVSLSSCSTFSRTVALWSDVVGAV